MVVMGFIIAKPRRTGHEALCPSRRSPPAPPALDPAGGSERARPLQPRREQSRLLLRRSLRLWRPHRRRPLDPPRRRALAPDHNVRPAVHHAAQKRSLFCPSTSYRDLALGPSLFHWESQSTTTAASATGQRYLHHEARGSRVLLFVREQRRQGTVTEPFVCLGFARYASHEGERIWLVQEWRSAGGWSGRFRWGGCQAVPRHPWRWRFEGAVQMTSGSVLSHPESRCLSWLVMPTARAASSAWASIPG